MRAIRCIPLLFDIEKLHIVLLRARNLGLQDFKFLFLPFHPGISSRVVIFLFLRNFRYQHDQEDHEHCANERYTSSLSERTSA